MKKIKISTSAILKKFKYHQEIKDDLLKKIDNSYNDNLNVKNEYYIDLSILS